MMADTELRAPDWWQHDHGDPCDCMALALATGAGPDAVDFNYCRQVLQKHWRLKCNHGSGVPGERATPQLPQRDAGDPVQAILAANAVGPSG
jgi:hypothetical protein